MIALGVATRGMVMNRVTPAGLAGTLISIRKDVRAYLDEVTATQWTDANLNQWINYAYWDVLKALEQLTHTRLTAQQDISYVANQQEYDLAVDGSDNPICEVLLDVENRANSTPIPILNFGERYFHTTGVNVYLRNYYGSSVVAYLRNNKIGFVPAPTADSENAVRVTYIQTQDKLTQDTDALAVPSKYKELIVVGAVRRAKAARSEAFPEELKDILARQWKDLVASIEGRDAQEGTELRWSKPVVDGRQGFA